MSSRRVGRRETRDGRALRRVDQAFWASERTMLETQLEMLEDFAKQTGIRDVIEVPAEVCRTLETRIQCLNASVLRAGKDEEANNWMDKRVISAGDRFENWYSYNQEFKMLMRSHQDPSASHDDAIEGQHKCIDIQCKHYVYGFDTDDALRRHISLHEAAQDNQARATSTIREKTSTMSLDDNLPVREMRQTFPDYDPSNSETERPASSLQSPFQKREQLKPMLDHQLKTPGYSTIQPPALPAAVKSSGPCLRCKVLKKRCDCMSPCKECPQQDILAPDLWKALGCFHGPLSDLSKKALQSIEECLFKIQLPDRELSFDVSYKKDDKNLIWIAELDMLRKNESFMNFDDQYWENLATRNATLPTTRSPVSPQLQPEEVYRTLLKKYGAAIAVLKASPRDDTFQYHHSAFNPFTLLRLGDKLSTQARDRKDWDLYDLAKDFLVASVHFREEFSRQQAGMGPLDKLNANATHSMTLPDIKTPLATFLRAFDVRFTNRKELTVDGWLGSFFALCIVSIVKTVLIDTSQATQLLDKQATFGAQFNTIYKVLVSVFSWSAKVSNWCPKEFVELRDPLLYAWSSDSGQGSQMVSVMSQQALRETKKMVHQSKWGSIGAKHSKDFLLSLGSGKFLELGFNGFMVQIFRHKTSERSHHAPSKVLADTSSFTPLQPKHQVSNNAMDVDYQNEPVNVIRPISQLPDDGIRPRLEARMSSGSRRSTFPEVLPPTNREFLPEKMPMAPPTREDQWAAKPRLEPISGTQPLYRPSGKSYHPRDPTESSDTVDENGYYTAPPRASTIGTTFTPVGGAETYDRDAAQRAKFQRRESRPDLGMHNRYAEVDYRDHYRPDINGRREDTYRGDHPVMSRDDPSYSTNRYQSQGNEPPYVPGGSYYQRTQIPQEDLYHKRRQGSPPPLASNQPREAPYNGHPPYTDTSASRNGLEKGSIVFGLNDSTGVVSSRKPKRRELSKEQREQAAAVRRMGACPDCKARKIKCNPEHLGPRKIGACPDCKAKKTKCDPSHHRDEDLRSSNSPQSPSFLVVEKPQRRTKSPELEEPAKEEGAAREGKGKLAPVAEMKEKAEEGRAGEEKLVVAAEE